jgi:hypothetical protein
MKTSTRSALLTMLVSALLVLPAGIASAREDKGHDRVSSVVEVAAGAPSGMAGTYTWTGDLFGLGIETIVTYGVEVDESGVPAITSLTVDESTLPEGAVATVWGPGSAVWERTTDDGDSVLKFGSRAGVAVQLDGSRAGVLVKLRGVLGDEPTATLRSIAIAAPVEEEEEAEEPEEAPVVVIEDPSGDDGPEDTDTDDDRRDRDRDRHRDDRKHHDGHDWDRDGDRKHRDGDRWDHDGGDGVAWERDGDDDDRRGEHRDRSGKGDSWEDCGPDGSGEDRQDGDDGSDEASDGDGLDGSKDGADQEL